MYCYCLRTHQKRTILIHRFIDKLIYTLSTLKASFCLVWGKKQKVSIKRPDTVGELRLRSQASALNLQRYFAL